jgi:hypothetical protein
MVKFSGRDDQKYEMVLHVIKDMSAAGSEEVAAKWRKLDSPPGELGLSFYLLS